VVGKLAAVVEEDLQAAVCMKMNKQEKLSSSLKTQNNELTKNFMSILI
jgi:hypothetical protein